ncbi:hypothetical protein EVAR_6201_1 [Eumeta japonica]|uniref:Uncharacterized protein n=1 Tax=Eumeta variegata TaxID=151549 RepID=A0A4C2A6A5_EUMVA|nr:hypothetical protein EVAR_6201_1 [Eumeta japonica]
MLDRRLSGAGRARRPLFMAAMNIVMGTGRSQSAESHLKVQWAPSLPLCGGRPAQSPGTCRSRPAKGGCGGLSKVFRPSVCFLSLHPEALPAPRPWTTLMDIAADAVTISAIAEFVCSLGQWGNGFFFDEGEARHCSAAIRRLCRAVVVAVAHYFLVTLTKVHYESFGIRGARPAGRGAIKSCVKSTTIYTNAFEMFVVRSKHSTVFTASRWCADFKRGRTSTKDDPRSGRPTTVLTEEMVKKKSKEMI